MSTPSGQTSPPDPALAWQEAYHRVSTVARALTPEEVRRTVPATPDWTVRELLAHVVGVGADSLAGNEDPDHAPAWTAAQVEARSEADVEALLQEWQGVADGMTEHMREHGPRLLADLAIHEHDLRGAVGRPGAQDTWALGWVTGQMLGRAGSALQGGSSLALVSPGGSWTSHGGDVASADVEVQASDFDVARALTTRRTAAQLRGWTVRGDVEDVMAAFTLLGPLPEHELPC